MYLQKDSSARSFVPNVINDKPVVLDDARTFPVIQGSSGKTVHYAQSATADTAIAAVEAAAEAFKSWKKTRVHERRTLLNRVADLLEKRVDEVVERETLETSCSEQWPRFDVKQAAIFVRETAASMSSVCGIIPPSDTAENTSLVFKEPFGPVLIIPPWNAPLILALRGISAAVAAGCTVVLKASELSPWSHQLILEVFAEAGVPAGVLNQIQATREHAATVTEAIIAHPSIRKIEFVGSANVGRVIGAVAAKHLKPVLMELGDQSPALVLDDADLESAAAHCVSGAMAHHGQVCFGTERIIVHENIEEAFSRELVEVINKLPTAGHAVTTDGAKKAHEILTDAVADGADFLVGSAEYTGPTSLKPSILRNVNAKSRIRTEESFAPSASLFVVKSDAEAVALANETPYGLSASIFTGSFERGLRLSRDLDFGQVQINSMTIHVNSTAPVTGYKGSGWGSNNAAYGIGEFMFNKHVSLCPQRYPSHY